MAEYGYDNKTSDPIGKEKIGATIFRIKSKSWYYTFWYRLCYDGDMTDVVIPDVEENGTKVKVPLIYGNPERWKAATKDGYIRDQRGKNTNTFNNV